MSKGKTPDLCNVMFIIYIYMYQTFARYFCSIKSHPFCPQLLNDHGDASDSKIVGLNILSISKGSFGDQLPAIKNRFYISRLAMTNQS